MDQKQIFTSSCPICGRTLMKGSPDSYIELWCSKCKEHLKIIFTNEGYQASVITQEKERQPVSYNTVER